MKGQVQEDLREQSKTVKQGEECLVATLQGIRKQIMTSGLSVLKLEDRNKMREKKALCQSHSVPCTHIKLPGAKSHK